MAFASILKDAASAADLKTDLAVREKVEQSNIIVWHPKKEIYKVLQIKQPNCT